MKNSDEQEDIPATNKAQEKHQALAISALGRAIRLAETFQRLGVEAQDAVKANGWLMTRELAQVQVNTESTMLGKPRTLEFAIAPRACVTIICHDLSALCTG